ncbi:MAG: SpoIIE family protein phosphatase, partial [Bacteroidota bacterium]
LNFGRAFNDLERYGEAEISIRKSYKLRLEIDNPAKQAVCLKYLGDVDMNQQNYRDALAHFRDAIAIPGIQEKDFDLVADASNQIARAYLGLQEPDSAQGFAEQSLELSREVGSRLRVKNAYETLAAMAGQREDYRTMSDYQKQVLNYRDSLFTTELTQKIADAVESVRREKEIEIHRLEAEKSRSVSNALFGILALAAILIGYLIYSGIKRVKVNRQLQEQQQEIRTRNEELKQTTETLSIQRDQVKELNKGLSEKQNEIESSFRYAQRIQRAVRPLENELFAHFTDHFVWDAPRDIVSGDFYWSGKHQNKLLFAVGDCTGHGVSGALMSILSTSYLNQILSDNIQNIDKPDFQLASILDQMRDRIKVSLHQTTTAESATAVKDGLDIALCMLDLDTLMMQYTGAYNIAYVIHESSKMETLGGDRMPVGIYPKESPFTTKTIQLYRGDQLYLFSDGYSDQIGGGAEQRKFLLARLKKLLLAHAYMSMPEQKRLLIKHFEEWKGLNKQIDDVMFMGLKV